MPTIDNNLATDFQSEAILIRSRSQPNDWFEACADKLRNIAALSDDWDSYGSSRPSSLSLNYAHAFLHFLRQSVSVLEPIITPTPNGNICFEWDDDVRQLITEIDDGGVHHYYYCYGDGPEIEDETIDSSIIRNLIIKL